MKLLKYIRNDLRLYLKSLPMQLAIFVIVPIVFSLFMGFSMSGLNEADSSEIDIDIALNNQDKGDQGQLLTKTLASQPLNDYFHIKERAAIEIHIPANFSQDVAHTALEVKVHGEPRITEVETVKSFLEQWQQSLINQQATAQAMSGLSKQDQTAFMADLSKLQSLTSRDQVQMQAVAHSKTLNSSEKYFISGLVYCMIMGLSSSVTMATKDEFSGLVKRLRVLPLSISEKILFEWISGTVIMLINICLMLGVMAFHPQVTTGNFWKLIPWLLLYSLFFQAVGIFLVKSLPKMFITIFVQLLVMLFVFSGFVPIGDIIGGLVGDLLSKNWLLQYVNIPLEQTLLGQAVNHAGVIALVFILLSLGLIGLSIMAYKRKETLA